MENIFAGESAILGTNTMPVISYSEFGFLSDFGNREFGTTFQFFPQIQTPPVRSTAHASKSPFFSSKLTSKLLATLDLQLGWGNGICESVMQQVPKPTHRCHKPAFRLQLRVRKCGREPAPAQAPERSSHSCPSGQNGDAAGFPGRAFRTLPLSAFATNSTAWGTPVLRECKSCGPPASCTCSFRRRLFGSVKPDGYTITQNLAVIMPAFRLEAEAAISTSKLLHQKRPKHRAPSRTSLPCCHHIWLNSQANLLYPIYKELTEEAIRANTPMPITNADDCSRAS